MPGEYPWDRSSYCIRWKILEAITSDTIKDLDLLRGSAFITTYFNSLGASIGKDVCLYPTGADPFMVVRCKLDPNLKATCFQPLIPESAYSAFNLNLVV